MKLNFFQKKKSNLIHTDSELPPRLRFATVLQQHLEKEGYRFVKSKNEFVLDFEFGRKVISFSYVSTMGYIHSVDCFIYIIFKGIESDFKKMIPNYRWTNWTLCSQMHWVNSGLYDRKRERYSDEFINYMAQKFIRELKPKIDQEFSKVNNYLDLKEMFYSDRETALIKCLRLEKQAILKLILVKAFSPDSLDVEFIKEKFHLENILKAGKESALFELETAYKFLVDIPKNKLKIAKFINVIE